MQVYGPVICLVVVALVLALCVATQVLARTRQRTQRDDGPDGQFESLCQSLALSITSDSEYATAMERIEELVRKEGLAESSLGEQPYLTRQEIRYLHELQDSAHAYVATRPWLEVDPETKAEILDTVSQIESTNAQTREYAESNNLCYQEAQLALIRATNCAKRARNLLAGEVESDVPDSLAYEVEVLSESVKQGLKDAKRALRLYVAENAGQIRYGVSVQTLIVAASGNSDIEEAIELLRQAVQQANEPDADERVADLPRARMALGLVLWHQKNETEEAYRLLRGALRHHDKDAQAQEVFDLLTDLAHLAQLLGKLDDANRYLDLQTQLVEENHSFVHKHILQNLHARARYYESRGWNDQAKEAYETAIRTAEKHYSFYDTNKCLKALANFYARQNQFKQACTFFDRLKENGCRRSLELQSSNPDELLLMATCYEECNRQDKADYYRAKAAIARKRLESIEAAPAPEFGLYAEGTLSNRITNWMMEANY